MAKNTRGPRPRPLVTATVGADTRAALEARAERDGLPFSRVVDDALRRGLGLAPAIPAPSSSPNP